MPLFSQEPVDTRGLDVSQPCGPERQAQDASEFAVGTVPTAMSFQGTDKPSLPPSYPTPRTPVPTHPPPPAPQVSHL